MNKHEILDYYDDDDQEMFQISTDRENLKKYVGQDIFFKGNIRYSLYSSKEAEIKFSKIKPDLLLYIRESDRIKLFRSWIMEAIENARSTIGTDPDKAKSYLKEAIDLFFTKPVPELIELSNQMVDGVIDIFDSHSGAMGKLVYNSDKKYSFHYHSLNVMLYCIGFAQMIKLNREHVKLYGQMGLLHDIGYFFIQEKILQKPGKLSSAELAEIRKHPKLGMKFLQECNIDKRIAAAAWEHHERQDGSGYPRGREAVDLAMHSRALAVIDAYEALTSPRPHRERLTALDALTIMKNQADEKVFDILMFKQFAKSFIGMKI